MSTLATLAYGLLGLPLAFAALPLYVHVPSFYAQAAGLELTLLGGILLGARVLDAAIDPWFGWLADRLPKRAMLAAALLPFGIGFVALLNPPNHLPAFWLLGALALTYSGFSAASVAYQAWGADMGRDSFVRTRLTAAREGFGLLGVVLAAALPSLLASNLSDGIARLAWVLPPLLIISAIVTLNGGRVRTVAVNAVLTPEESVSSSLGGAIADSRFRRLLIVFIANGIAAAFPATLFLFFVADVIHAEATSGALLALYFVTGAASLPVWVRLAGLWGRPNVWLAAMGLAMLSFVGAVWLGPGDIGPFAVICAASGLALGADLSLPAAIAADIGERQGRSGACFGIWNFVAKLNLALAAGLALPLLSLLGYVPGGKSGLNALTFTYALLPLAFKATAAALLWRWRDSLEIRQ